MITPLSILLSLFLGLLSLALPVVGLFLLLKATHPPARYREVKPMRIDKDPQTLDRPGPRLVRVSWTERWREPVVLLPLIVGVLLALLPVFGLSLVGLSYHAGPDEPTVLHGTARDVTRNDGTKIHVEVFGPADGPTLVLTHGWSTDNTEWYYAKKQLANRFRLIVWDLPGLGQTPIPASRSVTLEQMASDLHTVLQVAENKPVVVVGHSIGGMINLTFCRMYPESLGRQVAGLVELDSSYTNPVRTTKNSSLSLAIQKPLAEPILHGMILFSPIVRAVNWLSYQEGIAQFNNARSAFAGSETRGQVDLVSKYGYESSPAVVAKGTLAMFRWDATPVLPKIGIPVLMIVGKEDTTTLPSASETMKDTLPRGTIAMVSPGAHYSLLERNEEVNENIARFATKVLARK